MPLHSLVDGRAAPAGHSADVLTLVDPATEDVIGQLDEADETLVAAAVASARRAFDDGPWSTWPQEERRRWLHGAAELLRQHGDELAALAVLGTGLPWTAARHQAQRAAAHFDQAAETTVTPTRQSSTQVPGYLTRTSAQARGVVALVAPFPHAAASLARSLAQGNTCVLQPEPHAAPVLSRLVALLHDHGLPAGVVNLLHGRNHVAGAALAGDAGIDLVDCAGDAQVARAVGMAAAGRMTPLQVELNARAVAVVLDPASLDAAVAGIVPGAYTHNAHTCTAGTHLLVQRKLQDRFIAALVERTAALRVGHPMASETQIGPLKNGDELRQLLQRVEQARARGARVLCGGHRLADAARGHYLAPTVLLLDADTGPVLCDDVHGPLTTLTFFDTPEQALQLSQRCPHLSTAYVWTQDLGLATRFSLALRAREVWINTPMAGAPLPLLHDRGTFGKLGSGGDALAMQAAKTIGVPVWPAGHERRERHGPVRLGLLARVRTGLES